MQKTSTNSIKKNGTYNYYEPNFEGPILIFNSLYSDEEEEEDEDKPNKNFTFNSKKGEYEPKNSKIFSSKSNNDIIKQSGNKEKENKEIKEENTIFAKLINVDFKQKKLTPFYILSFFYLIFSVVEVIFGYYSNSITLMADAAHYFSESSCFAIYIVSIYVSRKKVNNNKSFGFQLGETIGVLVRETFLFGFSFWLLYYIIYNIIHPKIVNGFIIIILGIISTFFNLSMGLFLMFVGINNGITFSGKEIVCDHQHDNNGLDSYSIQKTFTNVIIKSIQSCIVILAGLLSYFLPYIKYIDPICTLLLTGILLNDAFNHMEGVIIVLMEGSPLEFDVEDIEKNLREIEGVTEVYDIHVWSLSIGKISMSCHLIADDPKKALVLAKEFIKKKYNITHSTIQI